MAHVNMKYINSPDNMYQPALMNIGLTGVHLEKVVAFTREPYFDLLITVLYSFNFCLLYQNYPPVLFNDTL